MIRLYEVHTSRGNMFKIQANPILFHNDFLKQTTKETLCFFRGELLVGMISDWVNVIDITEKIPENMV